VATLASDIITAAYRECNLVTIGVTPTTNEQTEALALLNRILAAVYGQEVGEELYDYNIGGTYDDSQAFSDYMPVNARMNLNLSGAKTIKCDPLPYDGQRMAVVDVAGNLATYNLTLDGNQRAIENAPTLTLSTNGTTRQWMYRADLGNWQKCADLALTDQMPFPEEFDDYFTTRLSIRLNPRNGAATAPETQLVLQAGSSAIQSRYRRPRPMQDMGTLGLLGQKGRTYGTNNSEFNSGRPRF